MSSLFIFGNGFDIAHGLPTKYLDFKKFLVDNYLTIDDYNRKIRLSDVLREDIYELSTELLISSMESATDENWSDFEEALGRFNFQKKFFLRENMYDENGNHNDDNILEYMMYIDKLSSVFIACVNNWQLLFSKWIKSIEKIIESRYCKTNSILQELYSESSNKYITFNYTKTLQEVYHIQKVIHIHNRKGQKLVFGHGIENPEYHNSSYNDDSCAVISSSFLDDMLLGLKKDTHTQMKKYRNFFKSLNKNIDKVYSYGFSYCKVDSIYIKEIIKKVATNATWYFTDFESADKENIRIKKIRLRKYGFKGKFDIYKT